MNKTGFTRLIRKKIDGDCKHCQEAMDKIVNAMKNNSQIDIFLVPEKNTHGIIIHWHINLK